MGRKGGVKEKFSICRFRLKKVKKVDKLRRFNARTLLLQIRSPRREERDAAHSAPRG